MDNNLPKFVENELRLLLQQERDYMKDLSIDQLDKRLIGEKTPQEFINDNIRNIMKPLYEIQSYSESNLDYLLQAVYSLSHFQNLAPLSLEDDEFEEVNHTYDTVTYRNKRNHKVFKEVRIFHLDGKDSLDKVSGHTGSVDYK